MRIVLGDMPEPVYRDLKRAAEQSGMEVVGSPQSRGLEMLMEVRRSRGNAVVMLAKDGKLPVDSSHFLSEFPDLKVLGVIQEHHEALLYEMRPQATRVTYASAADLIAMIRPVVEPRAG